MSDWTNGKKTRTTEDKETWTGSSRVVHGGTRADKPKSASNHRDVADRGFTSGLILILLS